MLSDQLLDLAASIRIQRVLAEAGAGKIAATVLAIALLAVVVDYARMLWLRSKMVRALVSSPSVSTVNERRETRAPGDSVP